MEWWLRKKFAGRLAAALIALTIGAISAPAPAAADTPPSSCEGDECQVPPPAPDDPTPGTAVVEGPSNPPVRFPKHKKPHKHRHHKHHGQGSR